MWMFIDFQLFQTICNYHKLQEGFERYTETNPEIPYQALPYPKQNNPNPPWRSRDPSLHPLENTEGCFTVTCSDQTFHQSFKDLYRKSSLKSEAQMWDWKLEPRCECCYASELVM